MKKKAAKIIKVYEELFKYNLKASSFKAYHYLSSISGWWKGRTCVKLATIAKRCNISINTAQRAVNELAAKGLIHKTICIINHKRTTNKYSVKALSGQFTVIERNVFFSLRDSSAFMTFCGIAMHKNRNDMAFPSLKQLAKATGLSVPTIISKVSYLQEHGYLHKQRYTRLRGDFGQNNHKLFKLAFRAFLMWYIVKSDTIYQLIKAIRHTAKFIGFDCSTLTAAGAAALMFTITLIFITKHFGEVNTS
ncbi:MAG: helix-turn-helix domain-containing protein [Oscillospiraceae bacterium]